MQILETCRFRGAILPFLLLFAVTADAGAAWRRAEIEGGSVRVLTRDPASGRIYAGGGQGAVFASEDGGVSWRRTNAVPFDRFGLVDLEAVDGALFAIDQGSSRLLRSTDGGATWAELDLTISGLVPPGLVRDVAVPTRLYFHDALNGLLRSDDLGATWTSLDEGLLDLIGDEITGFAQSPVEPQLLYATSRFGRFFRSTDGGATWSPGLGTAESPVQISPHPTDADVVFRLAGDVVERSGDRGASWQPLDPGTEDAFFEHIGFSPGGALVLGLGEGIGIVRSVDDGDSFLPVTLGINPVDLSDFLTIAGSSRMLAATDSGVLASSDDGRTWSPSNAGLSGVQAEDLLVAAGDGSRLYLLHEGGFARSDDHGASWTRIDLGEPKNEPLRVEPSRRSAATVFAAYHQAEGAVLASSSDAGKTWSLRPPLLPGATLSALGVDRLDDRHLVAGFVDGGLYQSTDAGQTWKRIYAPPAFPGGVWPHSILVVGDLIVAGALEFRSTGLDAGVVVRSDDGGDTWSEVFVEQEFILPDLAIDPVDPQLLYLTSQFDVHRSLDGGRTWRPLEGLPPGTVWDVATDSVRGDVVLVDIPFSGIVRSEDRGETWEQLPAAPGSERFAQVASADGAVVAATLTGVYTLIPGCESVDRLCLNDDRFLVEVFWEDFQGGSGSGVARPLTADTGAFWFFDPDNLELVVKVLDARAVNGHFWVFYGSLTNVEFRLRVTDRETGEAVEYLNASGQFASRGDTAAFDGGGPPAPPAPAAALPPRPLHAAAAAAPRATAAQGTCVADATGLCLTDGRFRVEVEWRDFQGGSGAGQALPITGSSDTGSFWFFDPANVELVVKVLDARAVNGHFWVFYGALSNVGYTLTVTDTETGDQVTYENPAGTFASRGDTAAFPD